MIDGFVYFIQEEESGNIMIGFSEKHPKGRLKDFQTGNSNKLTLLGYIEGTYKDESNLHKEFSKERIRKDNEWFKSSPRLKERIKELLEESLEENKSGIDDLNFEYNEGEKKVGIQDGQGTETYKELKKLGKIITFLVFLYWGVWWSYSRGRSGIGDVISVVWVIFWVYVGIMILYNIKKYVTKKGWW